MAQTPSCFRRLSVIMPVYNEACTLRAIVKRVLASPVELEIELICVDDASTDGSFEVLQGLADGDGRIKLLRHEANKGKGAAVGTAIAAMTGGIAVIQDADLEYDPGDYPALLGPILQGKADAVFGSRFASPGQRKLLLYWHSVANRFLTWVANVLNDTPTVHGSGWGRQAMEQDLRRLKGQRVWLFLAHGKPTRTQDHEAERVQAADDAGTQVDRVHAIGAAAYLYRLAP